MPVAPTMNAGALNLQPQGKPFVPSPVKSLPPATAPSQLDENSRSKLDGIVQQMQANKESDTNIQAVVNDFKQKYSTAPAPTLPAPKPGLDTLKANIGKLPGEFNQLANNIVQGTGFGKTADTIGTDIAHAVATPEMRPALNAVHPLPSATDQAGAALNVGSLLVPVGAAEKVGTNVLARVVGPRLAAFGGKAFAGATMGMTYDAGQELEQGKPIQPGVGTALGVLGPVAGGVTSLAKKGVQTLAGNTAPRIINSLIKPLLKDFSYGKDPGRTVAELGITGNNMDELVSNITANRQRIGQQASQLGQQLDTKTKLSVSGALSPIDEAMTAAARNNDSTVLNRLQDVKRAISKILVPVTDVATGRVSITETRDRPLTDLTYTQGLKIKQMIGDLTKFTGNHSDDNAVNSALKKAYGNVKGQLDTAASAADPATAAQLRKLNAQYADLTSAEVATKYRDKINERQNMISLPATATGIGAAIVAAISTGGAAVPALLAGISGVAIEKALSTPAVKTRIAAALSKMGPRELEQLTNTVPALKTFQSPGDMLLQKGKQAVDAIKGTPNKQGGFFNPFPKASLAPSDPSHLATSIHDHYTSLEQVLKEMPADYITSRGGEKALVADFQQEVVKDFKGQGLTEQADAVDKLNLLDYNNKEAFLQAVNNAAGARPAHVVQERVSFSKTMQQMMLSNNQRGFIKNPFPSANPFDKFNSAQKNFLRTSSENIQNGKRLEPKEWEMFQNLLKSKGFKVPEQQADAAELIAANQERSFGLDMSHALVNPAKQKIKQPRDTKSQKWLPTLSKALGKA